MPEPAPVYTAQQVRDAERPLIDDGVPLMDRASRVLADVVDQAVGTRGRILILAGGGDNGGDALYAAAHVLDRRAPDEVAVNVLLASPSHHEAGLVAAVGAGARTVDAAEALAATYDVVVDGLLGTGTQGDPALRGVVRDVVTALVPLAAAGDVAVVAVDLPSGLHPDAGTTIDGLVLPASVTVTFGGVKAGLVRARGPEFAGRVVLGDIGLTDALGAAEPVAETEVDEVVRLTG